MSDLSFGGFLIFESSMSEDEQQLRAYTENGSEAAFSELVSRHIDLVYSVALRLVGGDAHLAQDVVQTVFTDLSRKAKRLPSGVVLAGWLCRHAFFVASTAVRAEQRRRSREKQAVQMNASDDGSGPDWDRLGLILDEVLQGLGPQDRNAIVLRYFQGRDLKSVGTALGTNEDAAQKRVSRALEKLRVCLSQRGVTLASATLAMALTNSAVAAAPVGMATQVTATVLGGAGSSSGIALTWLKIMAWIKTKTAIVSSTAVLFTLVNTTIAVRLESARQTSPLAFLNQPKLFAGTNLAPAVASARNDRFGFHWSQIESTDYRRYIANLRAIDCPEPTIRDLIIADLNQAYASRMAAIWSPPVQGYWKKRQNWAPDPQQLKQLMTLANDKAAILKELLGVSVSLQELIDIAFLQLHGTESQLLFLPADQRQAALQTLVEGGFEEKVALLLETSPNYDERELFDDKLKLLAKVLSPDELKEFRLRYSPKAEVLRTEVQYLDCTEEEFKALLDLREKHLGPGNDNLGVNRSIALEDVRTLFGNDRAQDYELVSDSGYLNVRRASDRAGLASDLGDQAGRIAYEARMAVEKTARDASLSSEERQRRIQTLQAQAELRLNAAMGSSPQPAVHRALLSTLKNTAFMVRP
jgi:RNA polymerase sigma factor (sigma-70 family)